MGPKLAPSSTRQSRLAASTLAQEPSPGDRSPSSPDCTLGELVSRPGAPPSVRPSIRPSVCPSAPGWALPSVFALPAFRSGCVPTWQVAVSPREPVAGPPTGPMSSGHFLRTHCPRRQQGQGTLWGGRGTGLTLSYGRPGAQAGTCKKHRGQERGRGETGRQPLCIHLWHPAHGGGAEVSGRPVPGGRGGRQPSRPSPHPLPAASPFCVSPNLGCFPRLSSKGASSSDLPSPPA